MCLDGGLIMGVKAKIGDIQFEFDTEADLRMFLAAAKNGVVSGQVVEPETFVQKLRKFDQRIAARDKQRSLVKALLAGPEEGLTDAELRAHLGFRTNNELAGTMAGISKNAKGVGLSLEHVLTKRKLTDGSYRYRLTPDTREILANTKRAKSGQ